MNFYKLIFIFITVFYFSNCYSQQNEVDSLQKAIEVSTEESQQINAYKKLCSIFVTKDFDKSIYFSNSGLAITQKNKDIINEAYFLAQIGLANYFKGNYDTAAINYFKALSIFEKNKLNTIEKAQVLNELGKLFRKTKDLKRSLSYYNMALDIYKAVNNLDGMATILNESGVIYEYEENYDKAIERYNQSLVIREKLKDDLGKSYSLNFIGGAYTLQKKFSLAENYLLQSLSIREKLKDTFAIALNYTDLGYLYTEIGNINKAQEYYLQSNKFAKQLAYSELEMANYKTLGELAEKKNDKENAIIYLKKHYQLKDSIYAATKSKQIEELNTQYQTAQKEKQLTLQENKIKQKNILLFASTLTAFLLILFGFTFYKKKQAQNKIALQAEVMKQQDIATKAVLEAEERERERIARDLHDGVGQVMSAAKMNLSAFESELIFKDEQQQLTFEKIISLVDEGCKEVRSVSHQMMPNALLKAGLASAIKEFIDKINTPALRVNLYTEGLNERIDNNVETVLYRVIQECVNNVIKHSGANQLDISLLKDIEGISVTVEDNGKGFSKDLKLANEGIGLKNIKSRVEFLKGSVDFDSSEGKGTLVAIYIPLVK